MGVEQKRKQQQIVLNDDLTITINGYKQVAIKRLLYYILCIISVGTFYLLLHWLPKLKLKLLGKSVPIEDADELYIENSWGSNVEYVKVKSRLFKGKISDIFTKFKVRKLYKFDSQQSLIEDDNTPAASPLVNVNNSNITPKQIEEANIEKQFDLKTFEYRYIRFVFNPLTLKYEEIINWQDPSWVSVNEALKGIETPEKYTQRHQIFGPNISQVKQKSTLAFLLDEVLHPFYIFQVFSIILWCCEDYYYYAFCIFVMSVWSTLSTLKSSKKNLKKISEMSKFTCPVVVYRKDGQGEGDQDYPYKNVDSSELVPGDVMVILPNELDTLPCDAILLKGNCIVNESMLTGESMPVNKIPIKNEELRDLDFEKDDITDMENYCLFAGTKIVRVKGDIKNSQNLLVDSKTETHSSFTLINNKSIEENVLPNSTSIDDVKYKDSYQKLKNIYQKYESKAAYALVIRTGFNTAKGSLVRSMLFPKENFFKFYRDSFKFIFVLAMLALFGFCGTIYYFIKFGVPFSVMIIRALDLITVVVPPALPATMSIGTSFAISKLKKLNIFCISPNHVIVGGKLNLLCFDKTGTLTENGLCVLGVHFIEQIKERVKFSKLNNRKSKNQEFFADHYSSNIVNSASDITENEELVISSSNIGDDKVEAIRNQRYQELLKFAMATCHNLKTIDDELIGDPLDIEMFKFIDWTLEESDGSIEGLTTLVRPKTNSAGKNEVAIDMDNESSNTSLINPSSRQFAELGVLRVFEFASQLRRMSVIVRRMYTEGVNTIVSDTLEVFVKGAPETIRDLCKRETVPSDFDDRLYKLVNKGYRVIAVGYRTLNDIKYNRLMKIKRNEVEKDLEFLGFIIFENPLKPGTKNTIETLNKASIRSVMCTGDNILTGISVARECDMIDKNATVKILKFVEGLGEVNIVTNPEDIHGGRTSEAKLYLQEHKTYNEDISDSNKTLIDSGSESESESDSLDEKKKFKNSPPEVIYRSYTSLHKDLAIDINNEYYAMTGDVFDWVLYNYNDEQLREIIENCKVFARMLPDQKKMLVEKLQEFGHCVSFCGDGANDCGALKSSDVGLSLSEAEASVAAPLTSREMDLKCVLNVIKEGRAALVTNFSCFKYMAIYSLIQFTSVTLLYSLAVNLGDAQYLFIDLFLILPLAVAMGRSKSYQKIHPKAPSANLISFKVLLSLLGQVVIQMIFQFYIFIWSKRQPWYEAPEDTSDGETVYCVENTVLFYVSCFQYIASALVFCVGPPYRQPIIKNPLLIIFSALASVLLVAMIFMPENGFIEFMELMALPNVGRIHMLIVIAVNTIISVLAEKYLWNLIINLIRKKKEIK